MNPNDAFEHALSDWLRADSEHRVHDHLDDLLRRTSAQGQRPAWSIVERWVPAVLAVRWSAIRRPAHLRLYVGLAIVAILIATLIALAVGAPRPPPPPLRVGPDCALVSRTHREL